MFTVLVVSVFNQSGVFVDGYYVGGNVELICDQHVV